MSEGRVIRLMRTLPWSTRPSISVIPHLRSITVMKSVRANLTARYLDSLRTHLATRRPTVVATARALGNAALAAGLDTLDLARMHEQALVALAESHDFARTRNGLIKRAGNFFTEALVPLEKNHRALRASIGQLEQRATTLRLHTAALAKSNRTLKREVQRRKAGEEAVRKAKDQYEQLFMESQLMQKKLRKLTHQIIAAQEEERKEISRELHDSVVQTLVGINVELAALGVGIAAEGTALKAKIAHTQRLVESSVDAVHRFARELRPAVLDDLGLISALHAFSKNLAARKNLKIQLTASRGVESLSGAKRTVLFRVAQEALNNVVRHAHATEVSIVLTENAGLVRMEVNDNGRSFGVAKTLLAKTNKRLGLVGMRERVEMVGGTLTLDSSPGQGTTVRAEIPFAAS